MAKHYAATSLTGGGSGALDKINGALLSDGDTARVTVKATGRTYFYHLDAASNAGESSPEVIAPDTGAEAKRWILSKVEVDASTLGSAASLDMAGEDEAKAGAAADRVMSPAASRAAFDSWVGGKTSVPRQAILSGPVGSDGLPAHLVLSGNDVRVAVSEDAPLILSFAAGFGAQGPLDYFARVTSGTTFLNAGLGRGCRNYFFAQRDAQSGEVGFGVTDVGPEYSHKRGGMEILGAHTTYVADCGTVSASSEYNTTYPAWKAFNMTLIDGSDSWLTTNGVKTGWLQYVMPRARMLVGYVIVPRNSTDYVSASPKDWTLVVGTGATPDTIVDTRAGEATWSQYVGNTYLLAAPAACMSLKIDITANNGQSYVGIGEFIPLFGDDWFDLNTYTLHSVAGAQRQRVYLGHVDVSGAGVLSGLYPYALGDYAVRPVNSGANLAPNKRYAEENPFGPGAPVQVEAEISSEGAWGNPRWLVYYESGWGTRGVMANAWRSGILVATGLNHLTTGGPYSGSPFANSLTVTNAPARITCRRAF